MHQEKHLKTSEFITDVVIGMADGLTVPFALAAGMTSAVSDNHIVTTAGIAEIVAGSIAMGLGGFLAGKTEQEHYLTELEREYNEVETVPEIEQEEIKQVFAEYGLSVNAQNVVAAELIKDKGNWVRFMMKYELGLDQPDKNRATKSALTIGISYITGGIIPLTPYFFTSLPLEGLKISAAITIVCLFIFGYFKSKATGQPVLKGALKVTVIGASAAAAAFIAAKLI
jgi:VIT1/CCC1 family predicted Fe2+/Mn2+ transporter